MRNSIEKKYSMILFIIVALTVFTCWCANVMLLSKYYASRKEVRIEDIYSILDETASCYGIDSDEFETVFVESTDTFSFDILVMNQEMEVVASNFTDSSNVQERIMSFIFDNNDDNKSIIKKSDRYTVKMIEDPVTGAKYLELAGILSNGCLIDIRSAVSGIHDNARLANILLAYIGIIAILISYFIVRFVSKNISHPILQMVDISDRMANLDFEARYEGNDKTEIGLLGSHINSLSETLEKTISELKSTNAELTQELQKRTEIDEMRKEFLSNVSHELKTPIALIRGYAEGLTDCVNDDEESRNFYCEVIADEAEKMNELVRKLLELNELEDGHSQVSIERFDITELVKNCIEASDILFKQNDIKLEFDSNQQVFVWSDELKIEQVFNNYLSNAIHYADGNKIIRITVAELEDKVRVSVFNTGTPIPPEDIEHIWTKFYKVDKARTREYGGSGAGLSIVKASMDALSEEYGVINHEDGVEFWFEADSKNL